ncbi:MAG: NADH-quinone oxidoreductase subunit NuoN [Nocardioides sp.]
MTFDKPHLEYDQLWPLLVIFAVACIGLLVEAFAPRAARYLTQVVLTFVGLGSALVGTIVVGLDLTELDGARGGLVGEGAIALDGPAVVIWALILVSALGGVCLFAERRLEGGVSGFAGQAAALPGTAAERDTQSLDHTEVYPLMLFSVGGMMLFASANDLLISFVALEVLSLPLYLLSGLARRRRLISQEAALKYFLLGAFSSGFFLYGLSLVYGYAGSFDFSAIDAAVRSGVDNRELLLIGMGLISVGLFFKVGAVPFQSWIPDVYQGAPTAVTGFMAAATKIAAFGALTRMFYVAFGSARWDWEPLFWVIAIATMLVGSLLAIVQSDVKRMLAYSSVAHTGFILTGVIGVQAVSDLGADEITSTQAVLFYLSTYVFAMIGGFGLVSLVRDATGEATSFRAWTGLGRTSPWVAGCFAVLLLSMAGIPLTAGFVGKWAVFAVAASSGAWLVVGVAIASSVLAIYFYVRFIWMTFFTEPTEHTAAVVRPSAFSLIAIGASVAGVLVLGIWPGPLLDLLGSIGGFVI